MTTPPQEAYEAAARAEFLESNPHEHLSDAELRAIVTRLAGRNRALRCAVDAVWPIAERAIRAQVAAEIRAHANRSAPKDGNEAKQCLRRHLLIAARVAAGRPTLEGSAQAFTQWAARIAEGGQTP